MPIIDGLAISNAGKELVVLDLIHINFRTRILVAPLLFAFDVRGRPPGLGYTV